MNSLIEQWHYIQYPNFVHLSQQDGSKINNNQ